MSRPPRSAIAALLAVLLAGPLAGAAEAAGPAAPDSSAALGSFSVLGSPGPLGSPGAHGSPGTLARLPGSAVPSAPAHPVWRWPVAPPLIVLGEFRAPAEAWGAGHRGLDIAAAPGDEILSPADGIVHFRGWVVDRPVLSILHPGGYLSSYEPVPSELSPGDPVRAGEPIGVLGDQPGHCAGGCLHFGVRLHGEYVSPRLLLGGLEPSVLLPYD